jgi:hypothetical protein
MRGFFILDSIVISMLSLKMTNKEKALATYEAAKEKAGAAIKEVYAAYKAVKDEEAPTNRKILERAYKMCAKDISNPISFYLRIDRIKNSDHLVHRFCSAIILEYCLAKYLNEGEDGKYEIKAKFSIECRGAYKTGTPLFSTRESAQQARSILSEIEGWEEARFSSL